MPDLEWNKQIWDEKYDWKDGGEEWSCAFGGSDSEFHTFLLPRIHAFLPCKNLLEIAPGHGRWSRFLMERCQCYDGVDLAEKCVNACKKIFAHLGEKCNFYTNDGCDLSMLPRKQYNFIFSFDSLVHAPLVALESYIRQILDGGLLADDGVCWLHHSNLKFAGTYNPELFKPGHHNRDKDTSFIEVENLINRHGGRILTQEIHRWGECLDLDCITVFTKQGGTRFTRPKAIMRNVWDESRLARDIHSKYSYQGSPYSIDVQEVLK